MRSRVGNALGLVIVRLLLKCIVERRVVIWPAADGAAEPRAEVPVAELEPDVHRFADEADEAGFFGTGTGYHTQSPTPTAVCRFAGCHSEHGWRASYFDDGRRFRGRSLIVGIIQLFPDHRCRSRTTNCEEKTIRSVDHQAIDPAIDDATDVEARGWPVAIRSKWRRLRTPACRG